MFLNYENIILGVTNKTQKALINHLLNIIKNVYIFAPKCKIRDLNVIGAISFIKYVHMVEGVAVKSSSNRVIALEKQ